MSEELARQDQKAPAVILTDEIVAKYICPKATAQERFMFLQLCKGQNLNPFLREAYLIKYGSEPATMVVGKDTFLKRARGITAYRGFKAGVVVISAKNEVIYREGGIVFTGEKLVGGWAEVYREGDEAPVRNEVQFEEYAGKKPIYKNNEKVGEELNSQWAKKPATMIRKVAVVQSHREAFPDEFEGMYSPEEMAIDVESMPAYTVEKPAEGYKPPVQQPKEKKAATVSDARAKFPGLLEEYCSGDIDMMQDVCQQISTFKNKDGEKRSFTVADVMAQREDGSYVVSDQWMNAAYGKLKKTAEGKE